MANQPDNLIEVEAGVKLGPVEYLPELSAEEKNSVDKIVAAAKARLADAELSKTVTSTRPNFSAAPANVPESHQQADLARITKKGFLPQVLNPQIIDTDEAVKSINVNSFPRGDIDNFSVWRWAMADQRAHYTIEGSSAYRKYAPWESMYYDAARKVVVIDPVTKAQGDMVSGQDGGYLAPEQWSANFLDQLYSAQTVTQLPITRLPMGYRVVHMPKLIGAISISYAAENAALATTTASFAQLSFTARKQGQIIQISNELIRDAIPAADAILSNHAVKWMALDRDKQLLLGNGQSGAPVGLVNTGGVGLTTTTLATNAAPLFTEFVTGIRKVETLNDLSTNNPIGMATCTGVLGMPHLKEQIMSLKDTTNNRVMWGYGVNDLRGSFPASGGGVFDGWLGVPTWRFTNIFAESANSRHIYFGDWQWLYYMVRQDVEIVTSNVAGTAFQNDQTWIRLISRYDVGVAHPEAFFAYTNG